MTNEQIDAVIAEQLMGRQAWQSGGTAQPRWSPSTDLRHASEAEARLTEVQQHTYYSELSRVVNTPGGGAFAHIWSMLTATPAQRAAALLAVLRGGGR